MYMSGICSACKAILAPGSQGLCHRCSKMIRVQVSKPVTPVRRPVRGKTLRKIVHCPCGGIAWAVNGHVREGQYWSHTCLAVFDDQTDAKAIQTQGEVVQRLRAYTKEHMPEPRSFDSSLWFNGIKPAPIDAC